ncbi:MAG: class I adenylate-forming enzyme family protein [Burkholderiaceae bacterium]
MNLADTEFATLASLVHHHAQFEPDRIALIEGERRLDYAGLDGKMDLVVAALQREGVGPGRTVAICAAASIEYAVVFLGALRAGAAVAPLAMGSTAIALNAMLQDCAASVLFLDAAAAAVLQGPRVDAAPEGPEPMRVSLDGCAVGTALQNWLAAPGEQARPVEIAPEAAFNIIYSSGTTGAPKGIVQSHAMRWAHVRRGARYAYSAQAVTLLSTPLYSNTTLVVFVPTLAFGGTVVLSPKFDAAGYLTLAQQHRITHTMLVPVQYQRLLAHPDFDRHDLSAFRVKFATSAPFSAALKADVLKRWPGQLIEFYGMTEGGGTCILEAHAFPDKLHTVGQPAEGHDIRLIDEAGREVPFGGAGEVVGHSPSMMTGYLNQPDKTRDAQWFDATGKRFIRTGDIGRFDAQGFLTLLDRRKDMIISGGFNVYPSDIETVLREHPAVADAAVVGAASTRWGETPVAFVVLRAAAAGEAAGAAPAAADLLHWANSRLAKLQRLHSVELIAELPRSAIGKVLKRELRDRLADVD